MSQSRAENITPSIQEVSPRNNTALKRFIQLERTFLGSQKLFYAQTDADLKKYLSGRSAFCTEMEQTLFIAATKGSEVARCAAFINKPYQTRHNEHVGFIGYFAAAPNVEAEVVALLNKAEQWLAKRGVTRVIAPVNGTGLLGMGIRTDAFNEEPMFPYGWHPSYYAKYFARADYQPSYPLWHYEIHFSSPLYRSTAKRALQETRCSIRPLNKKRWKSEIETLVHLFNQGYGTQEWEIQPFTTSQFSEFFGPMKPLIDPKQFLFAEVDSEPVGNCFGLVDLSPLFRSFNGKLGLIERFRLLIGVRRRVTRAGLLNILVLPSHQGKHVGQKLAATLYQRYQALGLDRAFYYPVNESNLASRRLAESFGGHGRVLYHVYHKPLD